VCNKCTKATSYPPVPEIGSGKGLLNSRDQVRTGNWLLSEFSSEGGTMRSARFAFIFFVILSRGPISAQQTQSSTAPPSAAKDPQAVSVLNQALVVAGGTAAIKAIADYTASGNVTYNGAHDVQGTVTVIGLWPGEIRQDANLPNGVRSWAIQDGETTTKAEDQTLSHVPPVESILPSSDAFSYQAPIYPASLAVPHRLLAAVLENPFINISYKGVVQIDGHSAYDVQVQQVPLGQSEPDSVTGYQAKHFFIDTASLGLLMTQDSVSKQVLRQVRYADYRVVAGALVPFSITEVIGGVQTWEMQLSQISFNVGLQESAFVLQ